MTTAGQQNLNFAQNLQNSGFTPYSGQQVANFAPQQQQSFNAGTNLSNSVNGGQIGSLLNNVAGAPAQSVNASTIASQMSPYMNAYVSQALAPQVSNLNNQLALQSQLTQGQATSAGAFGDPRATMLQQNQNAAGSLQEQGLVGSAYTNAFNTAIGAGAQDVSNSLNAQTTNANLAQTQLQNQLNAANTMYGMQSGSTNLLNTLGGQQTAQSQAGLNAAYNQWLMAQQYPFQTTQLMNQTIGSAYQASPITSNGTSTTTSPNNSALGLLGALGGAALNFALPGAGTALSGMFSSPSYGGGSALSGDAYGGSSANPLDGLSAEDYGEGFAKGGRPPVNKPAIVGEKGPELFVPDKAGTVVPYEKLREALAKKKSVDTRDIAPRKDGLARQLGAAA